jgi:hypothetical protein
VFKFCLSHTTTNPLYLSEFSLWSLSPPLSNSQGSREKVLDPENGLDGMQMKQEPDLKDRKANITGILRATTNWLLLRLSWQQECNIVWPKAM